MSSEPLTEDCGRDQRHWGRRRPSQIISMSAMYTYFAWPETHKVLVFCVDDSFATFREDLRHLLKDGLFAAWNGISEV